MNKYAPQIFLIFFTLLALPNLAVASWWNPFSWFSKSAPAQPAQVIRIVETPVPITTGTVTTSESLEVEKVVEPKIKRAVSKPVVTIPAREVTLLPCDQDCLEHRESMKRAEAEARRQDAIKMENERIRQANMTNQNSSGQVPVTSTPPYLLWRNRAKINQENETSAFSEAECLAQKRSYLAEVDSAYLAWYDQRQAAKAPIIPCYDSNPIPVCDKEMTNVNVEWQDKITATIKIYQDKLTECAPQHRKFGDISKVIPSPY